MPDKVGGDQEAEQAGNTVSSRADAEHGADRSADRAADHAADERLDKTEVDTEDSGLGDAEERRERGRERHGLELLVLSLESDREAGAALCEVSGRGDRHPAVESRVRYHADLDRVVHMVYTAHDRKRVDRRRECRADAPGNGDEPLYSDEYPLFESGEDGTENSKGEIAGRKNCYQRGNKEVDHFGNDLVQPFFEERHEPYGYDDRYDVTLVARQVDLVKTEPDVGLRYRFSCFDHTGDRPCVDKVGMDHYHAYDRA